MPALEPLAGVRVVADARGPRRAPAGPATTSTSSGSRRRGARARRDRRSTVDDPDAIVEPEAGFVGRAARPRELAALAAHTDWPLPSTAGGTLAQGTIAGVPAKLARRRPASLARHPAAYADELRARLGWR